VLWLWYIVPRYHRRAIGQRDMRVGGPACYLRSVWFSVKLTLCRVDGLDSASGASEYEGEEDRGQNHGEQ
jgi:hypothetical protein